ncbi:MAG: DNA-directed RNA polymerase subunit omega [Omnitrophica WOR_2 bacterium RIFCSPLOWO2_12_FULL_50_9]|nr:MAG: DNA-directed RNA polymerase subunit omega [Omnitrophica WOR_2 bacterium RIFCSPHIGHO2_02_FULL_50_17]OGX43560.1 MAG: DNA-directed RNA polymerase subunit omega [Omnitrophica WOR_2 bacterium RIFCSPLOWO2_12_FULL_50_9]
MKHFFIEELLPKAGGSVYRLTRMAARRALELSEGRPSLMRKPSSDKVTTIALEEIAEGRIVYNKEASSVSSKDSTSPRAVLMRGNLASSQEKASVS